MKMKLKFANYEGKHFKWAAGSYFQKADQRSKTTDMGKTAQRIFWGIGTGLFGCSEDGYRRHWKGTKQIG